MLRLFHKYLGSSVAKVFIDMAKIELTVRRLVLVSFFHLMMAIEVLAVSITTCIQPYVVCRT